MRNEPFQPVLKSILHPISFLRGRATEKNGDTPPHRTLILTIAAIGIVYGDIGTSPLYAIRECFHPSHGIQFTIPHIYGVLSLIFWSLVAVISIDYLCFIMRADNEGEGGVLALMALLTKRASSLSDHRTIVLLGLAGAALLYGDGVITPAISVLSAVEGLGVLEPELEKYVVPISIVVLILLFSIQSRGTGGVGRVFGPVMIVWFLTLGTLGFLSIIEEPRVLVAMNPMYAINFLIEETWQGFIVLSAVFLVVTGGEALYADMGHFGRRPILLGWFGLAFPALVLNYFGQGALLLREPSAISNPFFLMAPKWALGALVVLATLATVIASQALISGVFSLTRQAVQLGLLPRTEIRHTSSEEIGQIYIPKVNWTLLVVTILVVIIFPSSSELAAAYGFSVATTMLITTLLMYLLARDVWHWKMFIPGIGWILIFSVKLAFFLAVSTKVLDGGWFPLLLGLLGITLMTTWWRGRELVAERLRTSLMPLDQFFDQIEKDPPYRIKKTAVFMTRNREGTPPALIHNLEHNKVLHGKVILLVINSADQPYVDWRERITVEPLRSSFYRVVARYGFLETPNVPRIIRRLREQFGLEIDPAECTYFLGHESLVPAKKPGMAAWRTKLFSFLSRNSQRATEFFRLPPNQVVEIGLQIEL